MADEFLLGYVVGVNSVPKNIQPVALRNIPSPPVRIPIVPMIASLLCNFGNLSPYMWYPGLFWNKDLVQGWTQASGSNIVTPYKFLPVNPFPWHVLNQGMSAVTTLVFKPTKIY